METKSEETVSRKQRQRPKTSYEINSYAQREMRNKIYPVRPFKRFLDIKQAEQGIDPSATVYQSIKSDLIKPIQKDNIFNNRSNSTEPIRERRPATAKWALGCTKFTPEPSKIPKVQQYTQYNFYQPRTKETISNYRKGSLPTDHIGMKIPEIKSKDSEYLRIKSEYNIQSGSNSYWVPYHKGISNNNTSSKNYNILNFQPLFNKSDNKSSDTPIKIKHSKYKTVDNFDSIFNQANLENNSEDMQDDDFNINNKRNSLDNKAHTDKDKNLLNDSEKDPELAKVQKDKDLNKVLKTNNRIDIISIHNELILTNATKQFSGVKIYDEPNYKKYGYSFKFLQLQKKEKISAHIKEASSDPIECMVGGVESMFFAGTKNGKILLFNLEEDELMETVNNPFEKINYCAINCIDLDQKYLICGYSNGFISIYKNKTKL